jgi:hypothetical protein
VRRRPGTPEAPNGLDDRRQRFGRRHLAVQQGERLAVVAPHAHLDPGPALVDHDSGNLEPVDLTDDRTVLDRDLHAGLSQHVGSLVGLSRRDDRLVEPGGDSSSDLATVDDPHARRGRELGRSTGQHRGLVVGEHVQVVDLLLAGPRQCGAQPPLGTLVEQHPPQVPASQRGPGRVGRGLAIGGGETRPAAVDERAELGRERGTPAVRIEAHRSGLMASRSSGGPGARRAGSRRARTRDDPAPEELGAPDRPGFVVGASGSGLGLGVGRLALALAVATLEAIDATTAVDQLLLARVEGMALVAELGVQLGAGRPGRERVAARAANRRDVVVGMDVSLHHELQGKVGGLTVCLETRVNSNVRHDRHAPDGSTT